MSELTPMQPLPTVLANQQRRQRTLELALYVAAVLVVGLLAALLLALYQLHHREVVYVTTRGIEPAGYVSEFTAREFAIGFIRWLHDYDDRTIAERNRYLAPQLCTEIQTAYVAILEAEADTVRKGRIHQRMELTALALSAQEPGGFTFRYDIQRHSTLLGVPSTFHESYHLMVRHAPAPDGTRRLCVAGHRRLVE